RPPAVAPPLPHLPPWHPCLAAGHRGEPGGENSSLHRRSPAPFRTTGSAADTARARRRAAPEPRMANGRGPMGERNGNPAKDLSQRHDRGIPATGVLPAENLSSPPRRRRTRIALAGPDDAVSQPLSP